MSKISSHNFLRQWFGIFLCLIFLSPLGSKAQNDLDFSGQLMQGAEFSNGYDQLFAEDQNATFLIGQRAQINSAYDYNVMKFYVSVQDIRILGSASHTKLTDILFSIYEAYFESHLIDNWKVKLGRQELNYGNVRFLGNLDWAFQGPAHDLALINVENSKTFQNLV